MSKVLLWNCWIEDDLYLVGLTNHVARHSLRCANPSLRMRETMKLRGIVLVAGLLYAMAMWGQAAAGGGSASNTAAINAQNANNLCRFYFTKPKAGMVQQYEAGRKKHNDFHRAQKDTWIWNTWAIQTGDNTGMYVTGTCGHAWKDFDEWEKRMGKADTADAAVNLGTYTESATNGFYLYRADMSLAPLSPTPAPMTAVTIYQLHPGAAPDFIAAIKKINDALSKQADWPKTSGWFQLMNGGEGPTFVLVNSRQSWADFAPLPKSVQDVLNETYGNDDALKTIRESTARLWTEETDYRADLSYVPAK